jgi:hypothetical protein
MDLHLTYTTQVMWVHTALLCNDGTALHYYPCGSAETAAIPALRETQDREAPRGAGAAGRVWPSPCHLPLVGPA